MSRGASGSPDISLPEANQDRTLIPAEMTGFVCSFSHGTQLLQMTSW